MKKLFVFATVLIAFALFACGTTAPLVTARPTLGVVQPTLTPYPTQVPPTPYPTQTLLPTSIPVLAPVANDPASVLLSEGFVPSNQTCDTPCQGYVKNGSTIVAIVYSNGSFGIGLVLPTTGNNDADTQLFATVVNSMYGDEVTSWIGSAMTDIANTGNPTGYRTGTVGNNHVMVVTKIVSEGLEVMIVIVPITGGTS